MTNTFPDQCRTVLTEARALISEKERWTQDGFAILSYDDDGDCEAGHDISDALDPLACGWCVVGAIHRAAGGDDRLTEASVLVLIEAIRSHLYGYCRSGDVLHATQEDVYAWNDGIATTHADVLAGLDRAAAV